MLNNFFPYDYADVFKKTAEGQANIVIQANHEEMHLLESSTEKVYSDTVFQKIFLSDNCDIGYKTVFLLGDPGTGKSHLITWIKSNLHSLNLEPNQRRYYWVLDVARNEGVMPILDKLRNLVIGNGHSEWVEDIDAIDEFDHQKIWRITSELCRGGITTKLYEDVKKEEGKIAQTFSILPGRRSLGVRQKVYNTLNSLLSSDEFIHAFLLQPFQGLNDREVLSTQHQKILYRLVADNINPKRGSAGVELRTFTTAHFEWTEGPLFPDSDEKQRNFVYFQTHQEKFIQLLNAILVDALSESIDKYRNITTMNLKSKIGSLRKNIWSKYQGEHEFIILFEDLVGGLSGDQLPKEIEQLFMSTFDEGIVEGEQSLCTLRSIIGCTRGYYDKILDGSTFGSQNRSELWSIATQQHFSADRAVDLIGKYLHSSRLGIDKLSHLKATSESWLNFDESSLPNKKEEKELLLSFGRSGNRYPLYPLNKASIQHFYRSAIKNNVVIIRRLIESVRTFLDAYHLCQDVPAQLIGEETPLNSGLFSDPFQVTQFFKKEEKQLPVENVKSYINFFNIYGCSKHPEALYRHFSLTPVDGLVGQQTEVVQVNVTSSELTGIQSVDHKPSTEVETPVQLQRSLLVQSLENWYNKKFKEEIYEFDEITVSTPIRKTAIKVLQGFGYSCNEYTHVFVNSMGRTSSNSYIVLEPKIKDSEHLQLIYERLQIIVKLTEKFDLNALRPKEQMILIEWAESQRHSIEKHQRITDGTLVRDKLNTLTDQDLFKSLEWTQWTVPVLLELHSLQTELKTESECMQALFTRVPLPKDSLPDAPECFALEPSNKPKQTIRPNVTQLSNVLVFLHEQKVIQEMVVPTRELLPYIRTWLKRGKDLFPDLHPKYQSMLPGRFREFLLQYAEIVQYFREIPQKITEERNRLRIGLNTQWDETRAPNDQELADISNVLREMHPFADRVSIPQEIAFLFAEDWHREYERIQDRTWTINQVFKIPDVQSEYMKFRANGGLIAIQNVITLGKKIELWLDGVESIFAAEDPNVDSKKDAFIKDVEAVQVGLTTAVEYLENSGGEQ